MKISPQSLEKIQSVYSLEAYVYNISIDSRYKDINDIPHIHIARLLH